MRTPKLTYEALLAALTLGAASSVIACSKGAAVRSEPSPAATASAAPTAAAASTPPLGQQAQPDPAPPPTPSPESESNKPTESSSAVDAGREKNAAPVAGPKGVRPSTVSPPPRAKPGGSAACGGSSCSPDMKKGN